MMNDKDDTRMTEIEHIEAAQGDMASLKLHLARIAKLNKEAGRDEINLVVTMRLRRLEVLHAEMGLDLLKYYPEVSVRGPGR
jgi:hypothetical protein